MSLRKIPTRQLGKGGPIVSAVGLGTMGYSSPYYGRGDDDECLKTLTHAADRGLNYWVTADIYVGSERVIGTWFSQTGRRSEITLCTSFGCFDPDLPYTGMHPDSSAANIHKSIARSLQALNTDYIDVYTQGRVDPNIPIEVVLDTLREYVEKGVIRWIGLSECSADVLKRAKAAPGVGDKIITVEREFSPFELEVEKSGFMQLTKELDVAFVAYCPLGRGMASGRFRSPKDFEEGDLRRIMPRFSEDNFPKNLELVDKLKAIGDKYNASAARVTLAWILAEHSHVIPIAGCRSVSRIEDNASAAELQLSPEDVKEIRKLVESADVRGERQPDISRVSLDCIPMDEWKKKQEQSQ